MAQHFLLSTAARSLSLAKVMRMSDEDAYLAFKAIRRANNDGEPFCPKCGCLGIYTYRTRRLFKCKACFAQFSVTSGSIFASRKMAHRDILAAIAIFVNGAKGHSALQLSRDLDCQYKTAFVLAHKIREAMGSMQNNEQLAGEVEVDGAYFGGYVNQNFRAVSEALGLGRDEIVALVRNGIEASLMTAEEKGMVLAEIERIRAVVGEK